MLVGSMPTGRVLEFRALQVYDFRLFEPSSSMFWTWVLNSRVWVAGHKVLSIYISIFRP